VGIGEKLLSAEGVERLLAVFACSVCLRGGSALRLRAKMGECVQQKRCGHLAYHVKMPSRCPTSFEWRMMRGPALPTALVMPWANNHRG